MHAGRSCSSRRWVKLFRPYAVAVYVLVTMDAVAVAQEEAPKREVRLEPVVVTATRTGLSQGEPTASVTVLDHDDVQTSASIAVDDILRTIPGFSLYRRSSSIVTSPDLDPEAQGVTLRGVGPSGTSRALVLVDGIPLIDPFDGQVFWGKISQENIERIEVVRGSGATLWGNYAMAGVINIITRKPTETGAAVKASYGTNGLTDDNLFVSGRSGKLFVGLEANFFNTDGFPTVAPFQRGPIDGNSSSRHEIFNGRVGYQLNDSDSVFLHGRFFDDDRDNGTPLRKSGTSSGLVDLNGLVHTDDGSEWQATLFSNMQSFDIQFTSVNAPRTAERRTHKQKIPFTDVGSSLVWSRRMFDPLLVTAGLDLHWIDGQSRDIFFDPTGSTVDLRQRSDGKQFFSGFFLQSIYTPTDQWEIALGGRVDLWNDYDGTLTNVPSAGASSATSFDSRTQARFNPKLSLLYRATEWLHLRAAGYRGFRAPNLAELYRQSEVEDLVLRPNPNLDPERLNGAEIGVDLPLLDNFDLRATGFWNEVEDPVTNVDVAFDPVTGDATERQRVNLGLARTFGAEVDVIYQVLPSVVLSGSYLLADATLVSAPPMDKGLEGHQLAQIPPNTFTLRARFSDPRLFTFTLEGRFVDEQFEDAENEAKFGSYFVLNSSLSRDLPFWNGEVFIAAENMFDREYAVDLGGGILKVGSPLLVHGGIRFRL